MNHNAYHPPVATPDAFGRVNTDGSYLHNTPAADPNMYGGYSDSASNDATWSMGEVSTTDQGNQGWGRPSQELGSNQTSQSGNWGEAAQAANNPQASRMDRVASHVKNAFEKFAGNPEVKEAGKAVIKYIGATAAEHSGVMKPYADGSYDITAKGAFKAAVGAVRGAAKGLAQGIKEHGMTFLKAGYEALTNKDTQAPAQEWGGASAAYEPGYGSGYGSGSFVEQPSYGSSAGSEYASSGAGYGQRTSEYGGYGGGSSYGGEQPGYDPGSGQGYGPGGGYRPNSAPIDQWRT